MRIDKDISLEEDEVKETVEGYKHPSDTPSLYLGRSNGGHAAIYPLGQAYHVFQKALRDTNTSEKGTKALKCFNFLKDTGILKFVSKVWSIGTLAIMKEYLVNVLPTLKVISEERGIEVWEDILEQYVESAEYHDIPVIDNLEQAIDLLRTQVIDEHEGISKWYTPDKLDNEGGYDSAFTRQGE